MLHQAALAKLRRFEDDLNLYDAAVSVHCIMRVTLQMPDVQHTTASDSAGGDSQNLNSTAMPHVRSAMQGC